MSRIKGIKQFGRRAYGRTNTIGEREYVDVALLTESKSSRPVLIGFQTFSDWYQAIDLSVAAAKYLHGNLGALLAFLDQEEKGA